MAQLKVILTDDEGNEVSYHEYLLGSELANLSRIENSVEQLRPALLSTLTHDLLAHEQSQYKKNAISQQRQLSRHH